jgi:hypothetical protein
MDHPNNLEPIRWSILVRFAAVFGLVFGLIGVSARAVAERLVRGHELDPVDLAQVFLSRLTEGYFFSLVCAYLLLRQIRQEAATPPPPATPDSSPPRE